MHFGIISLFPEACEALLQFGIIARARKRGLMQIDYWNPRHFTTHAHSVDDRPFGGGPGMVLRAEPVAQAIEAAKAVLGQEAVVSYLSPQGKRFNQEKAQRIAQSGKYILLAGRYEGIDERVVEACVDEELSIGDYVLSGGELPALVVVDAVVRLLPDALGHSESAQQDSFVARILDYPHYTRPAKWRNKSVPEVLLSGHHQAILHWRMQQALARTLMRRPDLLEDEQLSKLQKALLKQCKDEI
jgi:tRNA (guanine37-N1)-methyltransferase